MIMMKYTIEFEVELNTLVIRGMGDVTREGILDFHKDYLSDHRWNPGMNVILEFRQLSFSRFRPADIGFIRDLVIGSKKEIGAGKMAIVISADNDFGLARMWEMSTELFVEFSISVFRELEEAWEWIKR